MPNYTQILIINPIQKLGTYFPGRRCAYGGDDEYYVRVRETGNRQHEKISSEVTRENAQEPVPFHVSPRNF